MAEQKNPVAGFDVADFDQADIAGCAPVWNDTPMTIAYFDCFNGAGGDMIAAALIDAGADPDALRAGLASLGLDGYRLEITKTRKQGFAATRFCVELDAQARRPHRHLKHVVEIIQRSSLSERVKQTSTRVFERLAAAEAKVHGCTIEQVHFHEVGAVDAILDVTAAALGLELLGIDRVECSPLPVGSGTVTCEHGVMPVPAPATAELLRGVPIAPTEETGELTTPTAAAILTTIAERFGPVPAMTLRGTGFGAGTRDGQHRPNLVRVLTGESLMATECDRVAVLETNLDNATPETLAYALERLLDAGALDAFTVPIGMKKGRAGVLLTVICDVERIAEFEDIVFAETPTLGIRRREMERTKLARKSETVTTPYGPIRIKVAERDGQIVTASPEYEDCRAAAKSRSAPLRVVMEAAWTAWTVSRPEA